MLVSLPLDDVDENAVMVNALQPHASVVTQKSLAEGFGLTVAEAMWKGVTRPGHAKPPRRDHLGRESPVGAGDRRCLADALSSAALITRA
jgi:trehalose synthase